MKTSVSFLGSVDPISTIIKIDKSKTDSIHIDVADGLLVNNTTPFCKEVITCLQKCRKPKEVHLMTLHLKKFIDAFSLLKPESIIYEFEATTHHNQLISYIKSKKTKVGIAIGPFTNLENIRPYLKKVDIVLVMAIIPGYGGQKFLEETVERINNLHNLIQKENANCLISVDGGINEHTIKKIANKIDCAVAGSFIYKQADFNKQIDKLKNSKVI